MSTAQKFVAALQKSGAPADTSSAAEFWRNYLERWTADLEQLREAIRRWLGPVVDAGLARLAEQAFATSEADLGSYMAPGLGIELLRDPPTKVLVRPRGGRVVGLVAASDRRVVGACGRVDLEGPFERQSRAILLRFLDAPDKPPRWLSFADDKERELDEDVFFELLAHCAGIRWDA